MKILLILLACIISGCIHKQPVIITQDSTANEVKKSVDIPQNLLVECRGLSDIKDNPSILEVLRQHGDDVLNFRECKEKHKALSEVIKKAFNIK